MKAVKRFLELSSEERFKGWPVVGEILTGENIHFFGSTIKYKLQTGNGIEDYTSIIRTFGWAITFGVNRHNEVITLCQWKPGVNQASWELPPGGIGKIESGTSVEKITEISKEIYLKETGYGNGNWEYLGNIKIETAKYRGASVEDHGLPAHLFLATDLEQLQGKRNPNQNEIIETILVPLHEFRQVLESGLFDEASCVPCALLSLLKLKKLKWA